MTPAQNDSDLIQSPVVVVSGARRQDDVVDGSHTDERSRIRKMPGHSGIGDKDFVPIQAVVGILLVLLLEFADDREGKVLNPDLRAHGGAIGKELLPNVFPKDTDRAQFPVIRFIQPAAGGEVHGADFLVNRRYAVDGKAAGIVAARHLEITIQFRGDAADEVTLLADGLDVRGRQLNAAASALITGLPGGAAAPHDGDVGAECEEALPVTDLEAVANGHHEDNGGDAPGDAEHGEGAAQLVRPNVIQRLQEEFAQPGHGSTNSSPSFSPSITSVRWPLEMPVLTVTLRKPSLFAASRC